MTAVRHWNGGNAYWTREGVGVARLHRGTQQGSQGRQLLKHHIWNRCNVRDDRWHLHDECSTSERKTSPRFSWTYDI